MYSAFKGGSEDILGSLIVSAVAVARGYGNDVLVIDVFCKGMSVSHSDFEEVG